MSKTPGKMIKPEFVDDAFAPNVFVANELQAAVKQFNIEHGSKNGYRLIHSAIEGPENGVYVRGKSNNTRVDFPEYWKWLVYDDSITVHLTPIGDYKIYVTKYDITGFCVNVKKPGAEFFWVAYATRKDLPLLIVERQENEVDKKHRELQLVEDDISNHTNSRPID